jgi:NTE family protein
MSPDGLTLLSLCPLFSHIDPQKMTGPEIKNLCSDIEIVTLKRGGILIHQGDPSECMYALISGRLQVRVEGVDSEEHLVGELRPGETVGELGLVDGSPRMATVIASRDSQLVKVGAASFHRLVLCNAESILKIARTEAVRMRSMGQRRSPAGPVRTIMVAGDLQSGGFQEFRAGLCDALQAIGSVLYLNRSRFETVVRESKSEEAVASWLSASENANRFVVCEAEAKPARWTMLSARQSDRILLVKDASGPAELSPLERAIFEEQKSGAMPPFELVLLHAGDGPVFPGTSRWLADRAAVRHHHIRRGAGNMANDARRVARLLASCAIGLTFGGGGARGFAHVGVVRALEEASIPLDTVGGVSMGCIIAALHAMGHDWRGTAALARRNITKKLTSDLTLPIVSFSSGRRFERCLSAMFGNLDIEDLAIGFFCTSCNLSTGEMVVHRRGSLVQAVQASNAIPALLPPVLSDGHMLIDGGVLNNQPGDVLKQLCGGTVIVTNVSPRRDATVDTSLLRMPSPWRVLRSRISPFEPAIRVPGLAETVLRTLMVASDRKSREVERMADFYLRPPVDAFRVDDFDRLDEIAHAGYEYAREEIRTWKESGRYPPPVNP